MHHYKLLLAVLLVVISLLGCRKDDLTSDIVRTPPAVQSNIESTINGYVINAAGLPIPDATVSVINESVQTNEFGYFEIEGLVGELQAVVKVEKAGYFNQFKTLIPSRYKTDRMQVRLIEKGAPQSIQSSTGGLVTIANGNTVQFQADGFITASGDSYNGEVKVFSFFIDPTDETLDMNMPGNLMARDAEGELSLLRSFGMVNVELEGSAGQKLNISKSATLRIEVPSSISSDAPASIPLWYFDETTGLWKEEGSASLESGQYVGTVEHFTFWNCDIPIDLFTFLNGSLANEDIYGLVKICITSSETNITICDWTNEVGEFSGYVPKEESLLLEVVDMCGINVLHSETIGPFSADETTLEHTIINNPPQLVNIEGALVGCLGEPVSNGQIWLSLPGGLYPQVVHATSDGQFSASLFFCETTDIEVTAVDIDNLVYSGPDTYTVSSSLNLGNLDLCEGVVPLGAITLVIDGVEKIIPGCTVDISTEDLGGGLIRTLYQFEFTDLEPGGLEGPVEYDWTIRDVNNDLNNPSWQMPQGLMNYDAQPVVDSLRVYSHFSNAIGVSTTLHQEAVNPGDILKFEINNCSITTKDILPGFQYSAPHLNSTVIFNAVLQ